MKKHGNKNLLKIAALTSMSIFTLFTCFSAAIAWFQAVTNKSPEANSMAVVDGKGMLKQITFHHYIETDSSGNYVFSSTAAGTITYDWTTESPDYDGDTSVSLGKYTLLNKIHPLLLIVELNDTTLGAYDITLHTNKQFMGEVAKEELASTNNPLSSVVKFSSRNGVVTNGSGNYLFDSALVSNNFTSFATFTNGIPSFGTPVNGYYSNVVYTKSNDNVMVSKISIVINYYSELIEWVYGHFIGNEILNGDLSYYCDWSMEL